MTIGVITGTGTYSLPGLEEGGPVPHPTPHGDALVTRARLGDAEVLHVSRHGPGHNRLSNQVNHRANIAALSELGADAVIGVTVCGAVDPALELGSLIVFDDLHFLVNRLADGSLCTFHDTAGDPRRGHWIFEEPFSEDVRQVLLAATRAADLGARDGGCYGHVDGPRFNTRAEIRSLAQAGVTAVSQTAGPETVLCGEARAAVCAPGVCDRLRERRYGGGHAGPGAPRPHRCQHGQLRGGAGRGPTAARSHTLDARGGGAPLRIEARG